MDRRRFVSFSLLTLPAVAQLTSCKSSASIEEEVSELEAASASRAPNGLVRNLRFDKVPVVKSNITSRGTFALDAQRIKDQAVSVLNSKTTGKLNIRCGGHSYIGASVSTNGYVLDLSPFHLVKVNTTQLTVRVGGGCKLYQVIDELAKLPKPSFIPSGDCPTVGIGGFITGGGVSRLSNTLGFAVDKVVSLTAILFKKTGTRYTAEIVTASPSSNRELFWAMLGGGPQFGIIADITFRYKELPNYSLFAIGAKHHDEKQFIKFFRDWENLAGTQLAGTTAFNLQADNFQNFGCVGTLPSDSPDIAKLKAFASSHGGSFQLKPLTLSNMYTTFSGCDTLATCKDKSWTSSPIYFAAKSVICEKYGTITTENLAKIRKMLGELKADYAYFQFNRWSGAMNTLNPKVSFPFRKAVYECQISVSANRAETWKEEYIKWVDAAAGLAGERKGAFFNHVSHDILKDKKIYFGVSTARLDAAKKVYDPANVMTPFRLGDNSKI